MSIHQLAHHLQSAGRGDDKVLVHMTPKEVSGLQALAMAHGGSLTINPETGLPEAGFLSSILPTVIGAGLTIASGGALSPLMAAGLVGGGYGVATGSLTKGLMAGLGAYGGAGLVGGLASAGAAAGAGANAANVGASTAQAAANSQIGQLAATQATAPISAAANLSPTAVSSVTGSGALGGYQAANLGQTVAQPYATGTLNAAEALRSGLATTPSAVIPQATQVALQTPVATVPQASVLQGGVTGTATEQAAIANRMAAEQAAAAKAQQAAATEAASKPTWENVKAGYKDVTSSGTKAWDFVKKHPMPFVGAGLGLLSEFSGSGNTAPSAANKKPGTIRPYEYSVKQNQAAYAPNPSTAEQVYFDEPRFIPQATYTAKEGGLMSLAVGGPVEQMAAENSIGSNAMYPQSQLNTPVYSNPMMQRPMPRDVISSGIDAPTDRYTGEQRFALGGSASAFAKAKESEPTTDVKYAFDPNTQQYIKTTTTNTPATMPQDTSFGGIAKFMLGSGVGGIGNMLARSANPQFKQASKGFLSEAQNLLPKPTVTTATETSGGVAAPYVPPNQAAAADTSMVPNLQLQPQQPPEKQLGLEGFYDLMGDQLALKGAQIQAQSQGQGQGYATGGGISTLGGYSDGGRLLRGPGDGVSDSIPASIGDRQPARLADGEFVVPARIVSEIGNGSTEAGARKLYAMMDRVQKARKKTVGKNQVAKNTKADKLLPA